MNMYHQVYLSQISKDNDIFIQDNIVGKFLDVINDDCIKKCVNEMITNYNKYPIIKTCSSAYNIICDLIPTISSIEMKVAILALLVSKQTTFDYIFKYMKDNEIKLELMEFVIDINDPLDTSLVMETPNHNTKYHMLVCCLKIANIMEDIDRKIYTIESLLYKQHNLKIFKSDYQLESYLVDFFDKDISNLIGEMNDIAEYYTFSEDIVPFINIKKIEVNQRKDNLFSNFISQVS